MRVMGVGFSIALAFGNTIGVGILRLPGSVAAALQDPALVIGVWVIGGVYAILGAVSVAELAAMTPLSGGFYVFSRRAFGPRFGFAVGWNDWLATTVTAAYVSLTAVDFLGALVPPVAAHPQVTAIALIALFTAINWLGVRTGGTVQNTVSGLVGLLLVGLALACFVLPAPQGAALGGAAAAVASPVHLAAGIVTGLIVALRTVLVTYDGWYGAIYMSEETVDPGRSLPRAIIGCAALVMGLYVLINLGFLHALPLAQLTTSKLPAADVAARIFPAGGATVVTVVSLLTVLGLLNAMVLCAPRVLYALARNTPRARQLTQVGKGGTPQVATAISMGLSVLLVLSGSLEQLVSVAAVFFVMNFVFSYSALIRLRFKEPDAERPFRAWGYPVSTGIVLLGSFVFLVLAVREDPRSALIAGGLLLLSQPAYSWANRGAAKA
jgi:APA family basic amino acid/polyamine antiporter